MFIRQFGRQSVRAKHARKMSLFIQTKNDNYHFQPPTTNNQSQSSAGGAHNTGVDVNIDNGVDNSYRHNGQRAAAEN